MCGLRYERSVLRTFVSEFNQINTNMKKVVVLFLLLMSFAGVRAQKCLVIFGVNEIVTINPIKDPKFTLMFNDSIEVPFQQLQQESENTYRLEFDYRVGKFTLWVDADGHEEAYKEFNVSTKRNTMFGIGTIYMKKMSAKTLHEVTIQATRIKMVSRGDTNEKKLHLMSSHQLQYSGEKTYLEVVPMMDYMRNNYNRLSRSAQFTANPREDYRLEALDSLFTQGGLNGNYAATLLNRTANETEGKSDWIKTGVAAKTTVQIPGGNDVFEAYANGSYRRDTDCPLSGWSTRTKPAQRTRK